MIIPICGNAIAGVTTQGTDDAEPAIAERCSEKSSDISRLQGKRPHAALATVSKLANTNQLVKLQLQREEKSPNGRPEAGLHQLHRPIKAGIQA
jgi:hypothetical protein